MCFKGEIDLAHGTVCTCSYHSLCTITSVPYTETADGTKNKTKKHTIKSVLQITIHPPFRIEMVDVL